jgi:hypothetical protein
MTEVSVLVVVDPGFGVKLRAAAVAQPVWIAQVGQNRSEAEKLWQSGFRGVTTFVVAEPFNPEQAVAGILGQVLLHHPDVQEVRVVGCSASELIRERFGAEGFQISEGTHEGFLARSSAAA